MNLETELAHAVVQFWQQAVDSENPGAVFVAPLDDDPEYGGVTVAYEHDSDGEGLMQAVEASMHHGASTDPMFVAMAAPAYVVLKDNTDRPVPRAGKEMREAFMAGDERVRDVVLVNIVLRGSPYVYALPFACPLMEPLLPEAIEVEDIDTSPVPVLLQAAMVTLNRQGRD